MQNDTYSATYILNWNWKSQRFFNVERRVAYFKAYFMFLKPFWLIFISANIDT